MMIRMLRLLAVVGLLVSTAGCEIMKSDLAVTIPAESSNLAAQGPQTSAALGEVRVTSASRLFLPEAHVDPEVVRKAIQDAMRDARLFGDDAANPVTIDAEVLGTSIPSMDSGPFASSMSIRYRVLDAQGQALFDDIVQSKGRDDTGAFMGATRYWRSTAVTIGNNVAAFRDKFRTLQASGGRPAPVAARATAPAPRPVVTAQPPPPPVAAQRFPSTPASIRYPKALQRPDDVAVIIGIADYRRQGRDIPDVKPAYADAEGARLYATQALGVRDGNVIVLKDATGAQMTRVFGSDKDYRGQLYDWVKPGKSRVFVYYSGHGAPGTQGGSPYLVPADADAARIELNGYPLSQLYHNLGKLPADSVTVVLEACFSGLSQAGSVLGRASPVFFEVKTPPVPANLTVITAGAANQVASWEPDDSHGLFTRHFLEGMAGKADADKDGKVGLDELDRYLKDTLTYFARRHYGRDQQAQIVTGGMR